MCLLIRNQLLDINLSCLGIVMAVQSLGTRFIQLTTGFPCPNICAKRASPSSARPSLNDGCEKTRSAGEFDHRGHALWMDPGGGAAVAAAGGGTWHVAQVGPLTHNQQGRFRMIIGWPHGFSQLMVHSGRSLVTPIIIDG